MSKKRGNVNRLLNPHWGRGGAEWRLWDRSGQLWTLAEKQLNREHTHRLFHDPGVAVAIAEGAAGMAWVEPSARRKRWKEIEARTFGSGWQPPSDAPGTQPFEAMRFANDNGDSLVLFYDYD